MNIANVNEIRRKPKKDFIIKDTKIFCNGNQTNINRKSIAAAVTGLISRYTPQNYSPLPLTQNPPPHPSYAHNMPPPPSAAEEPNRFASSPV